MKITRILSLVMVVVMVLAMLVACNPADTTDPTGTTTAGGNTGTAAPSGDKDTLFDTNAFKKEYEGQDVNILCWTSEHREFEVTQEELTAGDPLLEGIYARNVHVADTLGVNLVWNQQDDGSKYTGNILKYMEVQADGGLPIDVVAVYSRTAGVISQKGHLLPVNYYSDYINLNNSWYPDALVEETDILGNTYYVSGDISTNLLYMTYGFVFNKDVMEKNASKLPFTTEDLYKLVEDGKWTLENMYKLVESYYEDADDDGLKSTNDHFGLRSYNYHLDSFYVGSNMKYAYIDNNSTVDNELVKVSADYTSEKAINLSDRLGRLFTSNYAINDADSSKNFAKTDGDLSFVSRIRDIRYIAQSENSDMNYGVLPIPKYDESQSDYKCVAGNPMTLWGISADSVDHDREVMAAAVIELMGYYAQTDTTEAIFETLFKGRYANAPEDAASFDIIRRTTSFDIGRVFTNVLASNLAIADQWSKAAAQGQSWGAICKDKARMYTVGAKQASIDFRKLTTTLKPTPAN